MAYRKFAADYLFTGKTMLSGKSVLVTDEAGKIHDIVDESTISDGVERYNGIICPGFINCHCHLELSHMKGIIPQHTGMIDFLITVINSRNAPTDVIADAITAEEKYMHEKGIVAVGDVCNTTNTIEAKNGSSLYFHNFVEAIGFTPSTATKNFEEAFKVYRQFVQHFSSSSIVPHAPYSISPELFRLIDQYEKGSLLSIHNQESKAENEFINSGKGGFQRLYKKLQIDTAHFAPSKKGALAYTLEHLSSSHTVILVHNVHTTEKDLLAVKQSAHSIPELWWCLCPNANLYINNELPHEVLVRQQSDKIVVGTDSLASNTQLNILEELKTLQEHFSFLTTEQLLKWATINGAHALRISSRYGSFEKGKQPGVVVIHGGRNGMLDGTVSRRVL